MNKEKVFFEQYCDLTNEKMEDISMNKQKRNITKDIFVAYLYTINKDERANCVEKSQMKKFLGECRPILITQTELGNYARELRTGKLFPIMQVESKTEWTSSKISYKGADEEIQYVLTDNVVPFTRKATVQEVIAYYTLYDDEKFAGYLAPIESKNKTKILK